MKNNQDLIQEIYSELVELGWPNNLEKQVNFGELEHPYNGADDFANAILINLRTNSKIPSKYFGIDDSNNQGELGEPGNAGIPNIRMQQRMGRTNRKATEEYNRILDILEIKGLNNE